MIKTMAGHFKGTEWSFHVPWRFDKQCKLLSSNLLAYFMPCHLYFVIIRVHELELKNVNALPQTLSCTRMMVLLDGFDLMLQFK